MKHLTRLAVPMAVAAALLAGTAAHANTISFYTTIFNTDYVTAGTGGMRDTGTGTITVAGVSAPITRSILYWHGPTNSTDPNANATVTVAGNSVTGTNIGFSSDNFWGHTNSQAYRADTSSVINGNGAYALSNFSKPGGTDINGAATLVAFQDADTTNNRDLVIFDGNDSNFVSASDAAGWDLTLSGINYAGGQAFLRLIVSDGQNFGPQDDGTLSINGIPFATGGLFQGNTLPGGNGTPLTGSNGGLFDIVAFDISSFLTPGSNSLHITLSAGVFDALSLVAAIVDLPAGAAPPTDLIPEPESMALVGLGALGMLLAGRRRSRKA